VANEKKSQAVVCQKRKYTALFGVLIMLLLAIVAIGGISLARYTQNAGVEESASVGAFSPVLACGDSWETEESFQIGGLAHPAQLPFTVTNENSVTPVLVFVELTAEQVLPLEYGLYLEDELLLPDSVEGNTYTYTHFLANGTANFELSVSLVAGEYDERFNGLTNDVRLRVVCEQAQVGGAG